MKKNFQNTYVEVTNIFISLRVHAEIRIFTPRDIKFRTILVRKTFSWQVWLHHTRQKTFHRTRIVMYY